jgi:DNA helicase-2/ATP-dependent DNA helicase PcrA
MITSIVEAIYDDYAKVNFHELPTSPGRSDQLAAFARQFKDVHEFLSQLALDQQRRRGSRAGSDKRERSGQSLQRASGKGLEFHTVFVIWLTDGMFPSSRSLDTRDALEEERRLFYVAITRARDELYLTYPHMRLSAATAMCSSGRRVFCRKSPNCWKTGK